MDRLWSPWRMAYIDGMSDDGHKSGCFLCAARDAADDRQALVFMRRPLVFAVLNRFPYNNGHALIVPSAHKGALADLADDEMLAMMALARDVMALFGRILRADGYNLGLNFGRVAGAGLPEHLHLHLVPRWTGDTNFMPVLADTKVIPQSLEDLFDRLRAAMDSEAPGAP
ncbi:MAG: HIT domain-containing protein [Planctomycetota bacterium]|nr:HIT domain-containing protein [Planctomycetota bacterium]